MKIIVESLNYKNIDLSIYKPQENNVLNPEYPCIIFAHGFKGFKDWGGFPYMLQKLAESGYIVVSFNFSHNGVMPDKPMDFTRLDLFAQNTHSIELEDLHKVIDYIYSNAKELNVDKDRIALIGHSRGGAAVTIAASEDEKIKALVTLASVGDVNRYTPEQIKRWREKGFIEIPNTRTNQMMRMNSTFLDDIEQNSDRLNIKNAFSRLKIPALIIHGKEDLAVKYTDAEKLYAASDKNKTELYILENTGHTFGIEHPFKGTTKAFDTVIEKMKEFLKSVLTSPSR